MADTRPLSERLEAAWVLAQTDSSERIDPGLLHEAAVLAARVEAAPTGTLWADPLMSENGMGVETEHLFGKRVALVPVEVGDG